MKLKLKKIVESVKAGGLVISPSLGVDTADPACVRITLPGVFRVRGKSCDTRLEIAPEAIGVMLVLDNVSIDQSKNGAPALRVLSPDHTAILLKGSSLLIGGGSAAGLHHGTNGVQIRNEDDGKPGTLFAIGGREGGAGVGGGRFTAAHDTMSEGVLGAGVDGGHLDIAGGHVVARGGNGASGIGGGAGGNGVKITVFGGSAVACGGKGGAGIGGGMRRCSIGDDNEAEGGDAKQIVIMGGEVEAIGGACGAGIGGGSKGGCTYFVMTGGRVNAAGGEDAAAVGGGSQGDCTGVLVTGGEMHAMAGVNGAGIGGGDRGSCTDAMIAGGEVRVFGGRSAAGIGGGSQGSLHKCSILRGEVNATGGERGAGIGGGCVGECRDTTVSGGSVCAAGGILAPGIGSGHCGGASSMTITGGRLLALSGKYSGVCVDPLGGARGAGHDVRIGGKKPVEAIWVDFCGGVYPKTYAQEEAALRTENPLVRVECGERAD